MEWDDVDVPIRRERDDYGRDGWPGLERGRMDEQAQELRKLKERVAGQARRPYSNSQSILWFIVGAILGLTAFGLGRRAKGGRR
jgi:hypothetical protein